MGGWFDVGQEGYEILQISLVWVDGFDVRQGGHKILQISLVWGGF